MHTKREPTPGERAGSGHVLLWGDRIANIEAEIERQNELLERLVEALEDGRGELDPAWD